MTQTEFVNELARHIKAIILACIRYYGVPLARFVPQEDNAIIDQLARNQSVTAMLDVSETRPGS